MGERPNSNSRGNCLKSSFIVISTAGESADRGNTPFSERTRMTLTLTALRRTHFSIFCCNTR